LADRRQEQDVARTLKSDRILFLATMLLVAVSVVMVYSASAVQADARYQMSYLFLSKQLAWAVIGTSLMWAVMRVDYHVYQRPVLIWSLLGATVVLLLVVFFFPARNGTQRWITMDFFSLQPSELAKLAVILFTASLLDRRMHRVNDVGFVLAPIGLVAGLLAGLILKEPDFGTAAVLVGIVAMMLFAGGLTYRYVFGAGLVLLPAAMLIAMSSAYRIQRLKTFLNPWEDPLGQGFQIIHSLYAVGTGGVLGKGLMAGVEKLYYLPEPHTDFIFAVIAEELGLVGTTLVVAAFALIAWRGLRASLLAPDRFGSLVALGVTMMVVLQALVNISVVTSLLPTKGIPLPFVSAGGSSLLISMVAMGILLNISQQSSATVSASTASGRRTDWTVSSQEA
jgi:cell division protein FtsW